MPKKIAVTGAAGQISYSFLFRLLSGEVFNDLKIDLKLLEISSGVKAAEGVAMEISDSAFKSLNSLNVTDDPKKAFDGADWVLMIGSKPRGPGMERSDLIRENGSIFVEQGKALQNADKDVKVIVVGNPCNTNALIALNNAQDISKRNFFAMTQLDQNRAKAQISMKAGVNTDDIKNLAIWGNHSPTMYPDFKNANINGENIEKYISDIKWLEGDFISTVQKRGAEIIAARGKSSAASAASSLIDNMCNLINTTKSDDVFAAGVISDNNPYGIPDGLIFSFPLRYKNSDWHIVDSFDLDDFAKSKIKKTTDELLKEKEIIKDLL